MSNVAEYKNFVPFCTDSKVVFKNDKLMLAKLTVGFGVISESYTSKVTFQRPSLVEVRALSHHLEVWIDVIFLLFFSVGGFK